MKITSVTYGIQETTFSLMEVVEDQALYNLAQELMTMAVEAEQNVALRPMVHRLMKAAAKGDMNFTVRNGARTLSYTGCDVDETAFFVALPDDVITLWN